MRSDRSGFARTDIQDTPQQARYSERAPSAPIRRDLTLYTVQCTPRGAPNGAPEMSPTAGGGLGVAPGGRAHHLHRCRLVTYGLAHLSTDSGVRSPRARVSSSSLSGAASIRRRQYTHSGHSSESTLFRKCTFGAIRRLTPSTLRVAHAAKACDGRDLCVYAVEGADGGPRGLAHHVRPPRRVPTGLAHVLSSTGGPRAAGAGLIQCTGRGASESGGSEHTDGEDTPFQGLYLESAPSAR